MTLDIQDKDAIKIPASALETMATLEELGAILVILAMANPAFYPMAAARVNDPNFPNVIRGLADKGIATASVEAGSISINLNLKGQEL